MQDMTNMGMPIPRGAVEVGDVPWLCLHNDWDNMRVKKGLMALRCRVCLMQFKMPTDIIVKCFDFFHFTCCPNETCPFLHIHKYKTKKKEQKHMHEATIAAKAVIDKGISLGAVAPKLLATNTAPVISASIASSMQPQMISTPLCISPGAEVPQLSMDFMDSPAVETPSGYGPLASNYLSSFPSLVPQQQQSPSQQFGVSLSPMVSPGPATGNPPTLLDSSMMESASNKPFDPFSKDHLRSYLQRKPEIAASLKKEALEGLGNIPPMQGPLPTHITAPLKSPSVAYSHNPYSPTGTGPVPDSPAPTGEESAEDDDLTSPSKGPKIALQSMLEGLEPIATSQVRVILPSGEVSAVTPESDGVRGSPLVYSCIKYSGKPDVNLSTLSSLLNLNSGEKQVHQGNQDEKEKRKKGNGVKKQQQHVQQQQMGYRGQAVHQPLQMPQQGHLMQQRTHQPPLIMPQMCTNAPIQLVVAPMGQFQPGQHQQLHQIRAPLTFANPGVPGGAAAAPHLPQYAEYVQPAQQFTTATLQGQALQQPLNPLQMVYR